MQGRSDESKKVATNHGDGRTTYLGQNVFLGEKWYKKATGRGKRVQNLGVPSRKEVWINRRSYHTGEKPLQKGKECKSIHA